MPYCVTIKKYIYKINRLNKDKNGGAWCPKQQVMRGVKEWIEIDLKAMHAISAIQTQVNWRNNSSKTKWNGVFKRSDNLIGSLRQWTRSGVR